MSLYNHRYLVHSMNFSESLQRSLRAVRTTSFVVLVGLTDSSPFCNTTHIFFERTRSLQLVVIKVRCRNAGETISAVLHRLSSCGKPAWSVLCYYSLMTFLLFSVRGVPSLRWWGVAGMHPRHVSFNYMHIYISTLNFGSDWNHDLHPIDNQQCRFRDTHIPVPSTTP